MRPAETVEQDRTHARMDKFPGILRPEGANHSSLGQSAVSAARLEVQLFLARSRGGAAGLPQAQGRPRFQRSGMDYFKRTSRKDERRSKIHVFYSSTLSILDMRWNLLV